MTEAHFDKVRSPDDLLVHAAANDGRVRFEVIHGRQNSFEGIELGYQLVDQYGFDPRRTAEVFDLAKTAIQGAKTHGKTRLL